MKRFRTLTTDDAIVMCYSD